MEYKEFVRYTVIAASLTLKRPDYKKKVHRRCICVAEIFCIYSLLSHTTHAQILNHSCFFFQIVNAPEILEVIHEIPHLGDFMNALYGCKYAQFFKSLGKHPTHTLNYYSNISKCTLSSFYHFLPSQH